MNAAKHYLHLSEYYFSKIISLVLVAQGLYGIYRSVYFIFYEIPLLEQQSSQGLINQVELQQLLNYIILIVLSSALSLFFAIRINALQSGPAKFIGGVIGTALVLGNTQITQLLDQIGTSQNIINAISESLTNFIF